MATETNFQKAGSALAEIGAVAGLCTVIGATALVAREWTGHYEPLAEIHLGAAYLPMYALFSLARGVIAYLISFLFTMVYGYTAARVRGADRVMLPVLDILQSIPVLGFLPGFVLVLVHLFPFWNIGLELASVLMIFTGQVWNMTFAFHASLKSVPEDLVSVSRLAKMTWWQRFIHLDLSFSATGLVWNSMMSMAGGWFFLTVSEAFVLGEHDFRLPGVGSYMSVAIEKGDITAQIMGVLAMVGMIVLLDQVVWRPIVAWSQKFSTDETASGNAVEPWLWRWIRRTRVWNESVQFAGLAFRRTASAVNQTVSPVSRRAGGTGPVAISVRRILFLLSMAGLVYGAFLYLRLIHNVTLSEWSEIFVSAGLTLLRVVVAVALATMWTVPVGVAIGRNPIWSRRLQPVIQLAASFPAPMLFPLVLGLVISAGAGLGIGSVLLLLMGTQWYVLFNVIAGSSAIPREMWEVASLGRFNTWRRWRIIILPAIFPSLLTGWVTAMGGAWNASIVAEYLKYKGQTLSTIGLGSLISQATDQGHFAQLAAAVGVMSLAVVGINRFIWRPLTKLAQERFNLAN